MADIQVTRTVLCDVCIEQTHPQKTSRNAVERVGAIWSLGLLRLSEEGAFNLMIESYRFSTGTQNEIFLQVQRTFGNQRRMVV